MGGDWDSQLSLDPRMFTLGVSEKVPLTDVFMKVGPPFLNEAPPRVRGIKTSWPKRSGLNHLLYLPLDVEQAGSEFWRWACWLPGP